MPDAPTLDHLVYAVPDLEAGVDALASRLGVRAAPGGRHEGFGTHNAILPVGGRRYVELIAPDPGQPAPGQPRPFGLDELAEPRLVTWAARVSDIERCARQARAAGFDPGRILEVTRRRPDGVSLRWKLTLRADPFGDGLVPFVIDWGASPHPTESAPEGCSLAAFTAEHPDPDAVEAALGALGVALEIRRAARPRLLARLAGPGGEAEL